MSGPQFKDERVKQILFYGPHGSGHVMPPRYQQHQPLCKFGTCVACERATIDQHSDEEKRAGYEAFQRAVTKLRAERGLAEFTGTRLERLACIGSFLIRNIDMETDSLNYQREFDKKAESSCTVTEKAALRKLHEFVVANVCAQQYILDRIRYRYVFT